MLMLCDVAAVRCLSCLVLQYTRDSHPTTTRSPRISPCCTESLIVPSHATNRSGVHCGKLRDEKHVWRGQQARGEWQVGHQSDEAITQLRQRGTVGVRDGGENGRRWRCDERVGTDQDGITEPFKPDVNPVSLYSSWLGVGRLTTRKGNSGTQSSKTAPRVESCTYRPLVHPFSVVYRCPFRHLHRSVALLLFPFPSEPGNTDSCQRS